MNLSNFNTSLITNMNSLFYNCQSLKYLDLSSFDTQNVDNMARMFTNNYNLTSLNLSSFNTDKVTTMFGMFSNCYKLETLDISNFNSSNADIEKIFDNSYSHMTIICKDKKICKEKPAESICYKD